MRILIIDNHDSFVYNIVGLIEDIRRQTDFRDLEFDVRLNDEIDMDSAGDYDALILSPGPGLPREAGRMMQLIGRCAGRIPILGICLGFQAIAEHFGGGILQLPLPRHGHLSRLSCIDPEDPVVGALAGKEAVVGRYHSWVVDAATLPTELVATSFDDEGNLMSLRHRHLPVFGTQFHPESIITDCGKIILENFLKLSSAE